MKDSFPFFIILLIYFWTVSSVLHAPAETAKTETKSAVDDIKCEEKHLEIELKVFLINKIN
jgi:hypothetical protein